MRSQSVVLDVQNVTKKFGLVTAVNHVSLQVTEGEIYGLTGPNDSGKTTLVKMILGHLRPTSGNIVVSGYDNQKEYADAVFDIAPKGTIAGIFLGFPVAIYSIYHQVRMHFGKKEDRH